MCTFMAIPLVLAAVQAAVQTINTTSQQKAAQQAASQTAKNEAARLQYQADVVENDRKKNAYDTLLAQRDAQRKTAAQAGQLRLLSAVNGVEGNTGSALDMLLNNSSRGAEDLFAINRSGQERDNDLLTQKNTLLTQAGYAKEKSKAGPSGLEQATPFINLGTSLLGSFAKA